MKATFEFDAEEIENFALKFVAKWTLKLLRTDAGVSPPPSPEPVGGGG